MDSHPGGGGRVRGRSSYDEVEEVEEEEEQIGEFEVDRVSDGLESSYKSRLALLSYELGLDANRRKLSRDSLIDGLKGFVIHPDNRWYRMWTKFILIWAIYSSFFTPFEFGFFRGLPSNLLSLDIAGQVAFFIDIFLQFCLAYRDSQTYRMVYKRTPIALRYLKSSFVTDFLGCMPWDIIYKDMEKDIRINYMFTRIVKLIVVELYCTHTAACIFYYLATTLPPEEEGYTWIGSAKMGDYSYSHFREIDIWKRYTTSLYFAIVTMATVGYGDVHAVNMREMIFVMIYVSFDMVLGAYLVGNMTALIVKGSKTERFRDRMTDIMKYMNRNRLGKDIRNQIKQHMRLKYESGYTEAAVVQDLPMSIRAKISQTLYQQYIGSVPLFKGCSLEFINQIVIRVQEEFFLPGEVIMEQGNVVDQLYFVCHGSLEGIVIVEDGSEETFMTLKPNNSFGELSILCNIPQPCTIRVCELCRLLRLDKQSFSNVLEIYFYDAQKVLDNLIEAEQSTNRVKQLESDVFLHIGKQEAELALKVNSAAYYGDLTQLKGLIRAGADPKKTDYDGRSPLHLAASRGYEDITLFLIHEGVDLALLDKFGNSPLLEAIKNGHDRVASLLVKNGASLKIDDAGSLLCITVTKGDAEFLRRLLSNGVDPNSKDYDHRSPLHLAASGGLCLMAELLIDAGANVLSKDRWGNTPLDEGRMSGNTKLIKLLEDAKCFQLSEFTDCSPNALDKVHRKKCTVFPFHPWDPKPHRRHGIVLWVPDTIEGLIEEAGGHLKVSDVSCLLSEDAGKIVDAGMIDDGQRLYLVSEARY